MLLNHRAERMQGFTTSDYQIGRVLRSIWQKGHPIRQVILNVRIIKCVWSSWIGHLHSKPNFCIYFYISANWVVTR